MINGYRRIASRSDRRKALKAQLSHGPSRARRRLGNTALADSRKSSYTSQISDSSGDSPLQMDYTARYSIIVIARSTPSSSSDEAADIAQSNMVATINNMLVLARTW